MRSSATAASAAPPLETAAWRTSRQSPETSPAAPVFFAASPLSTAARTCATSLGTSAEMTRGAAGWAPRSATTDLSPMTPASRCAR